MKIYFDINKEAYGNEIENYIAVIESELWSNYCDFQLGVAYDIVDGQFVQLWSEEFCKKKIYARDRIRELKLLLLNSDYKTQKYIEGQYTEEEWAVIKAERQAWRDEINELESLIPY